MAAAASDIAGKVWAIFFPILAFVVGGFEHCVANMFYIPSGILAAGNPVYAAKAQEVYGITAEQLQQLSALNSLHSFIPVTIGNILGGMLFVGIPCYLIQSKKKDNLSAPFPCRGMFIFRSYLNFNVYKMFMPLTYFVHH